jgi:hypothetical protein
MNTDFIGIKEMGLKELLSDDHSGSNYRWIITDYKSDLCEIISMVT